MSERIETLKKEDVLKNNFENRGLNINISDVNFTVKEHDSGIKKYERFISTIKRKKKKQFLSSTKEEMISFIEDISFGYKTLELEELNHENSEFEKYMTELLRDCAGLFGWSLDAIKEKKHPVRIKVKKGDIEFEGYTLLNQEFKKKYHNREWKLRRTNYKYMKLFDINSLIAETLAINSLEEFVRKDEELIRYLVTKHISEYSSNEFTSLPEEDKFSYDIFHTMKEYNLTSGEKRKFKSLNQYKPFYYLEKDSEGYISGIEHYLLQSIVVPEFVRQLNYVIDKTEEAMKERKDYAKSFQTKKQINKKTKAYMDDNTFLRIYGYVELDNKVDLEMFSKLEKEFVEFIEHVNIKESLDHSFRIKRLGQHKASGLYFPTFKATIIDVDAPDAFAHELGHQIDYTYSNDVKMLSEETTFRPIIDRYKFIVQQKVDMLPEENLFKQQWESKGKYNKNYFYKNTEIFARCFEVYLYSQGLETSFLKKEYKKAIYPQNEDFLRQIKEYFDKVLKKEEKTLSA